MSDIDHAAQAVRHLAQADNASGDHLSVPQAATIDALTGIGRALLAIHDDLGQILGELRIANYDRTQA